MQYRLFTLIFLILFTISCGGKMTVEHEVRQPDGQPFPDPYYLIETTDPHKPIRVSFFYTSVQDVEDLDQTFVSTQKFLDRHEEYFFSKEREDKLMITLRILNPRNMEYKIFCQRKVKFSYDGEEMDSYTEVAYSDMKYREFIETLPTEGIKEVTYSLQLRDRLNNLLVSTGKFHYYVSQ